MNKDEALRLALAVLADLGMKHYENTGEVLYKNTYTAIKAALEANDEPEQMAKLGWQVIDCPICGGGARAFPKQEAKDEPIGNLEIVDLGDGNKHFDNHWLSDLYSLPCGDYLLYTTPPQRKPLVFGLNDDGQFTFSVGVQTFTLDYFPENDEETEFMKKQLTHAIEAAHGIKGEA